MFKKGLFIILALLASTGLLYADKLSLIKEKGVLNAGIKYDFKPFGFINKSGNIVGFDVDLLKYISKKIGVVAKFQQVTSKSRIPMLVSGDIDIIVASMTHTKRRDNAIDFSISYFFDGQAMLVRNDEKKSSYSGFDNRKVGAIQGSSSGENFKKIQPNAKIVYYEEYPQAVLALKKGKIDAITTDLQWCLAQAKDSRNKLKVLEEAISYEPYGIGMSENESNFRDAINFAIQESVTDGTYKKLFIKWFNKEPKKLPEVWPL